MNQLFNASVRGFYFLRLYIYLPRKSGSTLDNQDTSTLAYFNPEVNSGPVVGYCMYPSGNRLRADYGGK
jgi:hypothetical protein